MATKLKKCQLPLITGIIALCGWVFTIDGQVLCHEKMNVGFLVDGSSKMGAENFNTTFLFIHNITDHFDVTNDKTWVFLVYGNTTSEFFKYQTVLMNSLIRSGDFPRFPNDSHVLTGSTLESAREQFSKNESHRGAVNVLVLFTSHKSEDDTEVPAIQLKRSNVTIFAIGIGTDYSPGELKQIATDPDDNHLINVHAWNYINGNLATEIARKICQVADRCVSSPCKNHGSCTSLDNGYTCRCSPEFDGQNCENSKSVEYLSLGCYNDQNDTRAIPSLEGANSTFLDGAYQTRENATFKCALEALRMGYSVFALQDGGACHSSSDALRNYGTYGSNSSCPSDGKGGLLINEVYLIGAKCGYVLKDGLIHISNSTIIGSSYNDSWGIPLLDGNYSWCPRESDSVRELEIKLGKEAFLTRLFVQGKKGSLDYADNYCFSTIIDGVRTQVIRNESTCLVDFPMGSSNEILFLLPPQPITAQYLRFSPWRPLSRDGLCLRIDVFGSQEGNNGSVPRSLLTDGRYNVSYDYTSIRGNFTDPPLTGSNISWCPAESDLRTSPSFVVNFDTSEFNLGSAGTALGNDLVLLI